MMLSMDSRLKRQRSWLRGPCTVSRSGRQPGHGSNPMLALYGMPGACSLASHIALAWAGVPFELRLLSHEEAGGARFTRLNPKGAVPVLVAQAGDLITNSLVVLQYIAALNANADLGARSGYTLQQARINECLAGLVSD
jgi:glutathione S-transferase